MIPERIYIGENEVERQYIGTALIYSNRAAWLSEKPAGVLAAFSMHRLWPEHTGDIVQVRRSSDDETADISTTYGMVSLKAISDFSEGSEVTVAKWYDQSGGSHDAEQSTAAKQPRILSAGGMFESADSKVSLSFGLSAGVSLRVPASVISASISGVTIFCRYSYRSDGSFPAVIGDEPNVRGVLVGTASGERVPRAAVYYTSGNTIVNGSIALPVGQPRVRVDRYQRNGTLKIRIEGTEIGSGSTSDLNLNIPATAILIGTNGGSSGATDLQGWLDTLIIFDGAMDTEDIEALEDSFGSMEHLTEFVGEIEVIPEAFTNSITNADAGTHIDANPFSGLVFETEATELLVETYNNYFSGWPGLTRIGVHVNGAYHREICPFANGTYTERLFFAPGSKTIELVNGPQSTPTSHAGTWVTNVKANAEINIQSPVQTGGLLVYGDSIAVGQSAAPVMQLCWFAQVKESYPGPATLEAQGSRALWNDAVDETARAAFVSRLASIEPAVIWLAIGTNDYGLNRWTAAEFESAYTLLLADLHAALPDAVFYAQTPIVRTIETANTKGSTMAQYRTAISTAASGKAYVTVVDGTAFMTTASLSDGVHPNTAGHALYANAVKAVLGI